MEGYVARASSVRGDVILRRRQTDGALELRVNGVFVMDTLETSSERLLARLALDAACPVRPRRTGEADPIRDPVHANPRLSVLVAGLGLGFTLSEVLRDKRVARVIVAEIEPDLVSWHHQGLVPHSPVTDERVEVVVGDVRYVVGRADRRSLDVLILDVDNGPDCLVHPGNAAIYGAGFLNTCRQTLSSSGLLAVWSADSSAELREAISDVFGSCDEHAVPVRLGRRETTYHLFFAYR